MSRMPPGDSLTSTLAPARNERACLAANFSPIRCRVADRASTALKSSVLE